MRTSSLLLVSALLLSITGCSSTGNIFGDRADSGDEQAVSAEQVAEAVQAANESQAAESADFKVRDAGEAAREAERERKRRIAVANGEEEPRRTTVVTKKIRQLERDKDKIAKYVEAYSERIRDLQGQSQQTAKEYYDVVAKINARLQRGTTPGNPILIEQAESAQNHLDDLANNVATLNKLANDISTNASVASYLLEAVRASYGLTGAVEEDHEELTVLEDQVNREVVKIDRQMNDIANAINRRASYLASERRNMQTIALAINNGELYGQSLANRSFFSPTSVIPGEENAFAEVAAVGGNDYQTDTPLVTIRFDRNDVEYDQAVYLATSQALERYPNVGFEVVAVAPTGLPPSRMSLAATDARNSAEAVYRSMIQMGIPGNRIKISATRSPMAQTPEVHVFLQ